jgi:hypothetical protein
MDIPFGKSVRGNHTTVTNSTKECHLYSVCITNSNGESYVMNVTRYQQSSWYYIRSPMNVSTNMESTCDKVKEEEKGLSCDNQQTRNNL